MTCKNSYNGAKVCDKWFLVVSLAFALQPSTQPSYRKALYSINLELTMLYVGLELNSSSPVTQLKTFHPSLRKSQAIDHFVGGRYFSVPSIQRS